MAKIVRFDRSHPRKLGETVFTDRGLRLPDRPARALRGGFGAVVALAALAAFLLVLFW